LRDELTGEDLPFYSSGTQNTLKEFGSIQIAFLLVGFNGICWQSNSTLAYFYGMQPFDLLYYARHINPTTDFLNSITELIDKKPISFMMLWKNSGLPRSAHKNDLIIYKISEYHAPDLKPENYDPQFSIVLKQHIYKMELNGWDTPPHFAGCYYHAKKF
jgi:hypothetical protein